jgi:mono/diheme cytochrome c family protein
MQTLIPFPLAAFLVGLAGVASTPAHAAAPQAELRFELPGRTQSITLAEMKRKLKPATLTVQDPVYRREKKYEGFWLTDLVKITGLSEIKGDEIVFKTADGYSPTLPIARLKERRGLVAFRDLGAGKRGWEPFRQGKATLTPAPFYLVWENADAPDEAFPWPYQLVGIEVVDFKTKYDRIFPAGADAAVMRGFQTFKGECLRCHSLNLQGGVLGPELNYPRNITEYWEEKVLPAFIHDPGDFRARSKMPAFPQLKEEQIQEVLAYLKWMKDHKRGE